MECMWWDNDKGEVDVVVDRSQWDALQTHVNVTLPMLSVPIFYVGSII